MNIYPAKLLLFGEHTILRGSRALAVPYHQLGGSWAWGGSPVQQQRLPELAAYLAQNWSEQWLDSARLAEDLQAGLFFDSNIPLGYGLGSSGALCAAVFDRYAGPAARQLAAADLKAMLAHIESFFHGSSSGVDPLLCYLGYPLCLWPDGSFSRAEMPPLAGVQFFLLDTAMARRTGPLVQYFLQRFDGEADFQAAARLAWMAPTEAAIDALLAGQEQDLWDAFEQISTFQRQQLLPMVPASVLPAWELALGGSHCRLKLCGAGGGGFMLGLSRDRPATEAALSSFDLLWV